MLDTNGDDFNPSRLRTQLELLSTKFSSQESGPRYQDLLCQPQHQQSFFQELCTALNIMLVIPATNAISNFALVYCEPNLKMAATYKPLTFAFPWLSWLSSRKMLTLGVAFHGAVS